MTDTCPVNDLEAGQLVPRMEIEQAEIVMVPCGDQRIDALGEDQTIRVPPQ